MTDGSEKELPSPTAGAETAESDVKDTTDAAAVVVQEQLDPQTEEKEEQKEEQKEDVPSTQDEVNTEEHETKEEKQEEEHKTEGTTPSGVPQSPAERKESDAVAEEVSRSLEEVPQLIRFLDEKDAEFGPMRTVSGALAARYGYCVAVLDALHAHLAARQAAADAYAAAMAALPPVQADTLFKTESVLAGGLEYVKRVAWTERESFAQLAEILRDAAAEVAALSAQVTGARTAFAQSFAGLEQAAAAQLEAARSHCSAYTSVLGQARTQGAALFERGGAADPWLVFARYCRAVPAISATAARMHEELLVALNTVARLESRLFQLVRRAAQKCVAMQSNLLNKVLVDDRVAFDILGKMDEHTYQQQFATSEFEQLVLPSTTAATAAVTEGESAEESTTATGNSYNSATGSKVEPLAVACAGCLDVGGVLLWTRHDAVLTRFGFLHLYPHSDDDFGDSDVAAALPPAAMDRFLHTPPSATLFLRGARISVDQSSGACCIRLVERAGPATRGWFGATHRAPAEHLFRVPSQQQLSRWIAEMHHFI